MKSITPENYKDMRERVEYMEQNDHVDGSSNLAKLLEILETDDIQWIDDINEIAIKLVIIYEIIQIQKLILVHMANVPG